MVGRYLKKYFYIILWETAVAPGLAAFFAGEAALLAGKSINPRQTAETAGFGQKPGFGFILKSNVA